jgi:hypothetical protein
VKAGKVAQQHAWVVFVPLWGFVQPMACAAARTHCAMHWQCTGNAGDMTVSIWQLSTGLEPSGCLDDLMHMG